MVYTPISDHRDLSCNPVLGVCSGDSSVSASDLACNSEPVISDSHRGVESKFFPPTTQVEHSSITSESKSSDLRDVKHLPGESVHHFWARLLLARNKAQGLSDQEIMATFNRNCHDKGILNALARRHIRNFTELPYLVQKYCAMESTRQAERLLSEPTFTEFPRGDREKRIPPKRPAEL